jgi:hypothetical protein
MGYRQRTKLRKKMKNPLPVISLFPKAFVSDPAQYHHSLEIPTESQLMRQIAPDF